MCWTTYKNEHAKQHIAKTNIIVYKVMELRNKQLFSYFQNFKYYKSMYSLHDNLHIEIKEPTNLPTINKGFHSYGEDCTLSAENGNIKISFNNNIIEIYTAPSNGALVLVKCLIPKGSIYYLNERNEYCSNSISIEDVILAYYYESSPMGFTKLSAISQQDNQSIKPWHNIKLNVTNIA